MRRFVFSFLILFFSFSVAFSFDRPNMCVQMGVNYFAQRGLEHDLVAYTSEFIAYNKNFDGVLGFQAYGDIVDLSFSGNVFPDFCRWDFSKRTLRLGFGAIYHFQNQIDIAYENDFLLRSIFELISKSNFVFHTELCYGFKESQIHAVKDDVPMLWDCNPAIFIKLKKLFSNGLEVYAAAGSFELYRYPLFIAPAYSVGASYLFKTGFKPYFEVLSRFCDMYTSPPYFDKLQFRMGVGFSF